MGPEGGDPMAILSSVVDALAAAQDGLQQFVAMLSGGDPMAGGAPGGDMAGGPPPGAGPPGGPM